MSALRPAAVLLLLFTLLTGVAYPLAVTGIAQLAFPKRASGSLIAGGRGVRGSELIGQPFADAKYFWGRPSATSPAYNAAASSGSNLGPSNPALVEAVKARVAALRAADPENTALVPVDLVTASGSGLDPHISPAGAAYQVHRVARARGLADERVQKLVAARVEGRDLGVLGEPRVNVLLLNLALDGIR
jgi:potassium-transporting ATPase KdpC subunit